MRGEATTSDMNGISWRTMDLSILLQSANRQLTLPLEVIENNDWNEKRKRIGCDGESGNGWANAVHRLNDRSWFGVDVRDRSVESVKWFLWTMNSSEWRRNLHERRERESCISFPENEWVADLCQAEGNRTHFLECNSGYRLPIERFFRSFWNPTSIPTELKTLQKRALDRTLDLISADCWNERITHCNHVFWMGQSVLCKHLHFQREGFGSRNNNDYNNWSKCNNGVGEFAKRLQ